MNRSRLTLLILLFPLTALARPEPPVADKADAAVADAAVRAVDQAWVAAFEKGDADALAALYADDAIVMDPGPRMVIKGREAIRASFAEMAGTTSNVKMTLSDHQVTIRGEVAWVTVLWEMSAHDKGSNQTLTMKGRASSVMEKRDGKWLYVVDHASVPFMVPAAK